MKKIMKNQIHYKHLFIFVLFLIFLFFLNDLVLLLAPYKLKKIDLSEINTRVYIKENVEKIINYNNIKQDISIRGYALIETENENLNRYVELIFKSDNYIYKVNTDLVSRPDVMRLGTQIMGRWLGYETTFSPIKMKEGIYELYIKVYENDFAEGVSKTNHRFIKDSKGLHEVYTEEVNHSILEQAVNYDGDMFTGKIAESFIKSSYVDRLFINGFFIAVNDVFPSDKLYIAVENEDGTSRLYKTFSYQRIDIAFNFKNEKYIDCGFTAQIPWEKLSNKVVFKLIANIDGKYYVFDEFSAIKKENTFVKDEVK